MERPLRNLIVSFLIVCYNHEKYIDRALRSVFAQKISYDFEVLIHDDRSSDGTVEKIKNWEEKFPGKISLFISSQERKKEDSIMERISCGIEVLLKQMKGDYFCLFDGDDYYINKMFVKKAVNVMENNRAITSCVFDFRIQLDGTLYSDTYLELEEDFSEGIINVRKYLRSIYIHSGSFVFRNILDNEKIEKLTSNHFVLDNIMIPFMLQFGLLYYIAEIAYVYSVSGGYWTSLCAEEQNVLTVAILVVLNKIAPIYKFEISKRYFLYMKYLIKHKNKIFNTFFDKRYYVNIAYNNKNFYLYNILCWNKISFFRKIMTGLRYFYMRATLFLNIKNLKNMFVVTSSGEHRIIRILGVSLKVKSKYIQLKRENIQLRRKYRKVNLINPLKKND